MDGPKTVQTFALPNKTGPPPPPQKKKDHKSETELSSSEVGGPSHPARARALGEDQGHDVALLLQPGEVGDVLHDVVLQSKPNPSWVSVVFWLFY